jgi:hypothetical protein
VSLQTFWVDVQLGPASASLPASKALPPAPPVPEEVEEVVPPLMWAVPAAPHPVHPAKAASTARNRKETAGVPGFWRLRKASSSKV